jgi:hypothetical protein
MRAFTLAAAIAVVLAAPAYAQRGQKGDDAAPAKTPMQMIDELKQRDAAEIERQYDRRAKRPDSDVKADPWHNIRATGTPQQKPR